MDMRELPISKPTDANSVEGWDRTFRSNIGSFIQSFRGSMDLSRKKEHYNKAKIDVDPCGDGMSHYLSFEVH